MTRLERLERLLAPYPRAQAGSLCAHLDEKYLVRGRYYHTTQHINEVLHEFDQVRKLAKDPVALEWALLYHDAILDNTQKYNEEKSAEFASDDLAKAGVEIELRARVERLILATKHTGLLRDWDEQLIADIDLAILGAPWPKYMRYSEAIRKEYAWVEQAAYVAGRTQVLSHFLARIHIYYHGRFRHLYEERARRNIELEIATLHAELET